MPSNRALRAGATSCCNESLFLRVNESCIGGYAATTGVFFLGRLRKERKENLDGRSWIGHAGVWLFDFTRMDDGVYFTSPSFLCPRFIALGFKKSQCICSGSGSKDQMDSIRFKCLLAIPLAPLPPPSLQESNTMLHCMQDIPRQLPNLDFVHPMFQTPQKSTSPHACPCEKFKFNLSFEITTNPQSPLSTTRRA